MSKFVPYDDKIEIRPVKKEKVLSNGKDTFIESGEVIAVGATVKFVKVGDTVYFDSWGHSKTPEVDGEIHYVVTENSAVLIGKVPKAHE